MKTDILEAIKGIGEVTQKGETYNLLESLIFCLDITEIQQLFSSFIVSNHLTITLVKYRIGNCFQSLEKTKRDNFLKFLVSQYQKNEKYLIKVRLSNIFVLIKDYYSFSQFNKIIFTLLDSRYKYVRLNGYTLVSHFWDKKDFREILVDCFLKYEDEELIEQIILYSSAIELRPFSLTIDEYFESESDRLVNTAYGYDFQLIKLRNRYFVKCYKENKEKIEELKISDIHSYLYIKSELREPVSLNEARKIINEYGTTRSLLRYFAKMGLRDLLCDLAKTAR